MFCFSFSCTNLLHGNCLLIEFNFSIKIFLAKIIFLFWILLRYLLNMSSLSIDSIFWYCFVVTLFCCSSHVSLFRGIPTDLSVFHCSAGITVFRHCSSVRPLFCRCSAFRSSVFWCFWLYSMPKQKTAYGVFFSLFSWLRSFGFFHYFGMRVAQGVRQTLFDDVIRHFPNPCELSRFWRLLTEDRLIGC